MSSTTALSNRPNNGPSYSNAQSTSSSSSSSAFSLAPAWLKSSSGDSSPSSSPAPIVKQGNGGGVGGTSNGHRSSISSTSSKPGRQNPTNANHPLYHSNGYHVDQSSQLRPLAAGDFPTLDASAASKARTAGQPASKKNWKEAALAVDLAAASKDPVPAQEREREREKEREKERLVNLVPKAPTPKKTAHGKGGIPSKNPRDRDNRPKVGVPHEPVLPAPPKPHTRSESPVLPASSSSSVGGGMVVLSMPKASKVDASSSTGAAAGGAGPVLRRSESAPLRETSPVLLPAVTAGGSAPSTPHTVAPHVNENRRASGDSQPVRSNSAQTVRNTSSLMQHFTSPPLDEAEEVDVPLPMAEEELRFMKELGWQAEDADEVAPLTSEEILQFKEFATMVPRTNKSIDEQRMLVDRSLSEWARRRAAP